MPNMPGRFRTSSTMARIERMYDQRVAGRDIGFHLLGVTPAGGLYSPSSTADVATPITALIVLAAREDARPEARSKPEQPAAAVRDSERARCRDQNENDQLNTLLAEAGNELRPDSETDRVSEEGEEDGADQVGNLEVNASELDMPARRR